MSIQTIKKNDLFGNLDFNGIANDADFKEDSVREVIILPILNALGYTQPNIVRSKSLAHPYLKVGSKKKAVTLVPDYVLKVDIGYAWVLDAKAPNEKIVNDENVEQVYSYAAHPEIRSTFFALCNGLEFSVFKTNDTGKPVLFFPVADIEANWEALNLYLAPQSFQAGKDFSYDGIAPRPNHVDEAFDYSKRPLLEEIKGNKQGAKRHYGVHGYFTKQTWNVVAEYIKNFSKPGDLVLDPFGGSGVTPVEALMNNRRAMSTDTNPMAVFLVQALIAPIKTTELTEAYQRVKQAYGKLEPHTEEEIKEALGKYPYPKDFPLPKGSDVKTVDQLFSEKQLAQLGLLKVIIKKEKNANIRKSLLLMFSGLLTKANLTYHTTPNKLADGRGDASAFRYYRYRIAKKHVDINLITYFELRYKKVIAAKKEMEYFINDSTISNATIMQGSAVKLKLAKESVDYVYTDPPYGKKIPYLDLSAMWNAWLDLPVTTSDYEQEAIEGGTSKKSKNEYNELIAESIKEMYRVLKFDRWLSFVFAHKDPEFWHLIIDTAESCGFEYIGAVPQKNGQTSFKKRQNPFTVLSGQLIINFRKVRNPRAIMKANLGVDIAEIVIHTIEACIARFNGATLEQINDELIIKGLELGFLDLMKKQYSDLTPILISNFTYDEKTEQFTIKKDAKFKSHIDVRLRIKYYLQSYLLRMERENKNADFDSIIMNIIPLLKNGTTPEHQTIQGVLDSIAEHTGPYGYRLRKGGQQSLFV